MKNDDRFFYLFACPSGTQDQSPETVFYETRGESIAESLCGLFVREYADDDGNPTFSLKDAESISPAEQVLMDELLELLAIYDEPDPGIYDPEPSADVHLRAQYAVRASKWEELLRRRRHARDQDSEDGSSFQSGAPHHGSESAQSSTSSATMSTRDRIFVSYSHKDKKPFEEFKTMLAPAIQNNVVDLWDDTRIELGARWKEEIQTALRSAKVAVLLVSKDFLASDFIAQHEFAALTHGSTE